MIWFTVKPRVLCGKRGPPCSSSVNWKESNLHADFIASLAPLSFDYVFAYLQLFRFDELTCALKVVPETTTGLAPATMPLRRQIA